MTRALSVNGSSKTGGNMAGSGSSRRQQAGSTTVELILVLLIIGILVNLGFPNYVSLKKRADAAHIIGDFNAIRTAAYLYYAANGDWPPGGDVGTVPASLEDYMPEGLSWDRRPGLDVRYAWDNLGSSGQMKEGGGGAVAVSIYSRDSALLNAVDAAYRGRSVLFGRGGQNQRLVLIVLPV